MGCRSFSSLGLKAIPPTVSTCRIREPSSSRMVSMSLPSVKSRMPLGSAAMMAAGGSSGERILWARRKHFRKTIRS